MWNSFHIVCQEGVWAMRKARKIYLRETVNVNPSHHKEIMRIGILWSAFWNYCNTMNSGLPFSRRRRAFNPCVLPVLTCGVETSRLTKDLEGNLRSARREVEKKKCYCMERQEAKHYGLGNKDWRYFGDDKEKRNGLRQVMLCAELVTSGQPE